MKKYKAKYATSISTVYLQETPFLSIVKEQECFYFTPRINKENFSLEGYLAFPLHNKTKQITSIYATGFVQLPRELLPYPQKNNFPPRWFFAAETPLKNTQRNKHFDPVAYLATISWNLLVEGTPYPFLYINFKNNPHSRTQFWSSNKYNIEPPLKNIKEHPAAKTWKEKTGATLLLPTNHVLEPAARLALHTLGTLAYAT